MILKKIWKKYLLLFGIIFAQIAFLPYPNLVLFWVLINQDAAMALLAGFILDLYSPWPFGINMFAFIILVYFFNYLSRKLFKPNYLYYIIIGIISVGYNFIFNALLKT